MDCKHCQSENITKYGTYTSFRMQSRFIKWVACFLIVFVFASIPPACSASVNHLPFDVSIVESTLSSDGLLVRVLLTPNGDTIFNKVYIVRRTDYDQYVDVVRFYDANDTSEELHLFSGDIALDIASKCEPQVKQYKNALLDRGVAENKLAEHDKKDEEIQRNWYYGRSPAPSLDSVRTRTQQRAKLVLAIKDINAWILELDRELSIKHEINISVADVIAYLVVSDD